MAPYVSLYSLVVIKSYTRLSSIMAGREYKPIVDPFIPFLQLLDYFENQIQDIEAHDRIREHVNALAIVAKQAEKVASGIEPQEDSQWTDYLIAHHDILTHRLQAIYICVHYKKHPTDNKALNAYLGLMRSVVFTELMYASISAVKEVGENGFETDVLGYLFAAARTVLALYSFSLLERRMLDEWRDLIKSYWQERMPKADMARSLGINIKEPSYGFLSE